MSEIQTQQKTAFLNKFEAFQCPVYGGMIDLRRAESRAGLENMDLPSSRQELWKYTRTGSILNKEWKHVHKANELPELPQLPGNCYVIVFLNGVWNAALSSIGTPESGLKIYPLSKATDSELEFIQQRLGALTTETGHFFTEVNNAFWSDGAVIRVAQNAQVERPIHIINWVSGDQSASTTRHLIEVAQGAEVRVVQSFLNSCTTETMSNTVTEAHVSANARLTITKIQAEADQGHCFSREQVKQAGDSTVQINTITATGGWVRNDVRVDVEGQNCTTNLYGTYSPEGKELVDNHTVVDHLLPHCESNELYKGIVSGNATGVFNGKVYVRQDAQKTNAFQQNANIVMDDSASMFSKPELEIYADDVKCSHGSTTGQFDEDAVFYLKSRGISETNARRMLVHAFIGDVLDHLEEDEREYAASFLRW